MLEKWLGKEHDYNVQEVDSISRWLERCFAIEKENINEQMINKKYPSKKELMDMYFTRIDKQSSNLGLPEEKLVIFKNKQAKWQDIWNIYAISNSYSEELIFSLFCDFLHDLIALSHGNERTKKGILDLNSINERTEKDRADDGMSRLLHAMFEEIQADDAEIKKFRNSYFVDSLPKILASYKKLKTQVRDEQYMPLSFDANIEMDEDYLIDDKYSNTDWKNIIGEGKDERKLVLLMLTSGIPLISLKLMVYREKFHEYFALNYHRGNGRRYRSVFTQYELYKELTDASVTFYEESLVNKIFAEDFMCYNATAYLFEGFSVAFQPFIDKESSKRTERNKNEKNGGKAKSELYSIFAEMQYWVGKELDMYLLEDMPEQTQDFLMYVMSYVKICISIKSPVLRMEKCKVLSWCIRDYANKVYSMKNKKEEKRICILHFLKEYFKEFNKMIEMAEGSYNWSLVRMHKMAKENIFCYEKDSLGEVTKHVLDIEDLLMELDCGYFDSLDKTCSPEKDSRYRLLFEGSKEKSKVLPRNKYKVLSDVILSKTVMYNSSKYDSYCKYFDFVQNEIEQGNLVLYNGKLYEKQ